jgi:hypothetical protein
MTASLSKKAIGESHRPRGKCCVSWQAEAARHAVIPVPLDTDGIEERAGLAADRVPARAFSASGHPTRLLDTWQRAIEDGGRFGRVVRCAARWPAGRPSLATERRAG